MAAALALALGSAAYTIYNSESQKKKAKDIRKNTTRPNYEVPAAVNEMVAKTRFNAGKYGLPGQAQIEAKLDENAAGTRRSLQELGLSPFAMMGAIASTQKQTDNAVSGLGIKAAEYKDRAEGLHLNSLGVLAGEQNKKWAWDKQEPYLDATAAASAYENAALRNQEAGVNSALKAGSNYLMMQEMRNEGYGGYGGGYRNPGVNVDGNYRSPITPMGSQLTVPESITNQRGGGYNGGGTPYRMNSSDISSAQLKMEMEAKLGMPLTDSEFLEYARQFGYQF